MRALIALSNAKICIAPLCNQLIPNNYNQIKMNKTIQSFVWAILCFSCLQGFSQREADKKLGFDHKVEDLFFHEFSAVPIVLTEKTVAGIDAEKGTKIWEVKGDRFSALGGILQSDESNYEMVPFSPYIIVSDLLIDTRDGKIILDKENSYKRIKSFELIPELQSYLIQCTTDEKTKNKIFLVELASNSVKWQKEITIAKKGTVANININKNDALAFTLGSNILIMNGKSGEVVLNEKQKSGAIYQNPDQTNFYFVEAAGGGLGSMMGAAITANLNKLTALGEKIYAYNATDGTKLWKKPIKLEKGYMFNQEVDGKMFIQNQKGGNVYDYATGEALWKKDFEKKRIVDIEKDAEGYMVYYGAKKILLDEKGKKLWKKPQLNGNEFLSEVGEDDLYDSFEYNEGAIIATSYRIAYYKNGVKKPIWKFSADENTKIAYDGDTKNLIVLDGKSLYVLNPDKGMGKETKQKLGLKKPKDFNLMEIRGGNYFLSSPWEFAIIEKNGTIAKTQYFPQPGESGRKWLNTLSAVGSVAGAAYQVSGVYNVGVGGTSGLAESVTGVRAPGTGGFKQAKKGVTQHAAGQYGQMASEALYNPDRMNAFSDSKDYAFYFTKNGEGAKYLSQVSKDSGEEMDKFTFLDNKPNYHVDEVEKRVLYSKGKELHIFDYK